MGVGNMPSLFENVHAAMDFDVNVAIVVDVVKLILGDGLWRDDVKG